MGAFRLPQKPYAFIAMQQHMEQTAHLQAALLHSMVRAQIRTAWQG
jgi:hypothetical protein